MEVRHAFRQLPNSSNTVFRTPGIGRMRKIYCRCGRIISMDSNIANLKISLGKELECPLCRNSRIAEDIDAINMYFDGIEMEEDY